MENIILIFAKIAVVVMMWIFSAIILTVGIYIVGKIFGWLGDLKFWDPFPKALIVTFFLSIISAILSMVQIPYVTSLIGIAIWFIVIMKAFEMDFMEALILSVLLFFLNLFGRIFLVSVFMSIVRMILSLLSLQ